MCRVAVAYSNVFIVLVYKYAIHCILYCQHLCTINENKH